MIESTGGGGGGGGGGGWFETHLVGNAEDWFSCGICHSTYRRCAMNKMI